MICFKRYNCLIYLQLCLQFAAAAMATSGAGADSQPVRLKQTVKTIKSDTQPSASGNKFININEADDNGLYLLGLFDVHQAASSRAPLKCGPIELDAGELSSRRPMQNLAAFLWAIDQINQDSSLLPGIKLGSLVMDTCSSFLLTNQQLANLLHPSPTLHQEEPNSGAGSERANWARPQLPGAHQLVAIVADNHDWQSVEAVTSMASALGLTTFVTQSRSTKLNELARRYAPTPAAAKLEPISNVERQQQLDERLLSELLGIGRMMITPPPEPSGASNQAGQLGGPIIEPSRYDTTGPESVAQNGNNNNNELLMIRMLLNNEIIADSLASLCDTMKWDLISVIYDDELDMVDLHEELIRQLFLRNTQLALDEQIVVSGDGSGFVAAGNHHNLYASKSGTASAAAADDNQQSLERLLLNLAKKTQFGARVVVSLLGLKSARNLQSQLHKLRLKLSAAPLEHHQEGASKAEQQLKQLNSLLWITVTDREPYYSFASDSLGLISVAAGTSSLMSDFKSHYDTKPMVQQQQQQRASNSSSPSQAPAQSSYNKWWPEYLRAVLVKQAAEAGEARGLGLLASECAKWLEPKASPLNEKCRSLSLSSLVDTERINLARLAATLRADIGNKTAPATTNNSNKKPQQQQQQLKLSKYLAGGWEHNGMSVINSVLAIANGLESIRQSLCPDQPVGMCQQMRSLVQLGQSRHSSASSPWSSSSSSSSSPSSPSLSLVQDEQDQSSMREQHEVPMLSELLYSELGRSTFQLADGQMFSLDDGFGGSPSGDFNMLSPNSPISAGRTSLAATGTAPGTVAVTQLDSKVKFYNLRLLRPNLIGFVKFGQFDQQDGLVLSNQSTDAVHYASIPADFSKQTPIEQVQSTCLDERRCLMLNSLDKLLSSAGLTDNHPDGISGSTNATNHYNNNNSNNSSSINNRLNAALSEEELAEGVNSLLKLDHPLITQPVASDSSKTPMTIGGVQQQQRRRPGDDVVVSQLAALEVGKLDGGVRTMRSQPQVFGWQDAFSSEAETDDEQQQSSSAAASNKPVLVEERRQFEVIVLLPLHESDGGRSDNSMSDKSTTTTTTTTTTSDSGGAAAIGCSGKQIDEAHAFQQLAALAYAQTLANGQQRRHYLDKPAVASPLPKATNLGNSSNNNNRHGDTNMAPAATADNDNNNDSSDRLAAASSGSKKRPGARPELVVSVIDYCGQIELVEERLLAKLALNERLKRQQLSSPNANSAGTEVVAIVDFDSRVSAQIGAIISGRREPLVPDNLLHLTIAPPRSLSAPSPSNNSPLGPHKLKTLRVDLLPSKVHEIDALVRLIKSSLPSQRLVHLIYTDQHEYRDEFVRRANEANICVSKLIWIPEAAASTSGPTFDKQLRLTSQLFQRELYDYSSKQPSGADADNGLNSTRVLVMLASSSDSTNQLIWRSASQSMLNDYVWLTSHEWLNSIELPAEMAGGGGGVESGPGTGSSRQQLPRYFISTKMETFQGHGFRQYFTHLTPALHAPLPTDWFDDFWQQHFKCRLPMHASAGQAASSTRAGPQSPAASPTELCQLSQRLEWNQMIEDDLVHYTVRALESIYLALDEFMRQSSETTTTTTATMQMPLTRPLDGKARESLVLDFKSAFDTGRVSSGRLDDKRQAATGKPAPLVGFHLVHRLLTASSPQPQQAPSTARRTNSRHLAPNSGGRLVRIGLWRQRPAAAIVATSANKRRQQLQQQLTMFSSPVGSRSMSNLTAAGDREPLLRSPLLAAPDVAAIEPADVAADFEQIRISLDKLAGIKSLCSTEQTCSLCKQQIAQTQALIRQQEARLSLSESLESFSGEPKAISSIGGDQSSSSQAGASSSLDSARFESNFADDDEDDEDDVDSDQDLTGGSKQARSSQSPSSGVARPIRKQNRAQTDDTGQAAAAASSARPNATSANAASPDDIQAAASSLFDSRTSQQVSSETRRAYSHYLNHQKYHHHQRQAAAGQPMATGLRQHSSALMSILSLIGVAFTVASMTYFYPNMLDYHSSRWAASLASKNSLHNNSFRSTTSSTCNMIADDDQDDEELYLGLGQHRPQTSPSFLGSILANINDYLILIGLLMLYTINIAFLLPATMSVCSFRRVGLSVSYIILFSSILVRIVAISRQANSTKRQRHGKPAKRNQRPRVAAEPEPRQQQQVEPAVDESVEVTFESLPYDDEGAGFSSSYQQQPQQQVASISISQQQQQQQQQQYQGQDFSTDHNSCRAELRGRQQAAATTSLFLLPLALLVSQFLISISWLVKQQPEPTLYYGCWHCSSPLRSSLLFHYEHLLILGQPALLLIVSWLWSLVLFRTTSANEQQYRLAIRRFLSSQPLSYTISNNPEYLRLKQRQFYLNQQLRESKSLVITNILLVFVWSLLALATISSSSSSSSVTSSHQNQVNSVSSAPKWWWSAKSAPVHVDDMSLVYTNLISGAIIFGLLFVYRLNLFNARHGSYLSPFKRARSQYNSIKSSHDPETSSAPLCGLQYLFCCCCSSSSSSSTNGCSGGQLKLFKNCRGSSQTFAVNRLSSPTACQQQHQDVHKFNSGSSETDVDHSRDDPSAPGPRQQSLFGSFVAASGGANSSVVAQAGRQQQQVSGTKRGDASSSSGQERLKLKQFNTYGTYSANGTSGATSTIEEEGAPTSGARPGQSKLSSVVSSVKDGRKLPLLNKSKTSTKTKKADKVGSKEQINSSNGNKRQSKQAQQLQRRQSNGSLASSSTAKLVVVNRANQMASSDDSDNDDSMLDTFDTISCTMSVASNATSQLQGNDLYPIDCSLQLDNNITNCNMATTETSAADQPRQAVTSGQSAN